ncbi:MAG: hypothetical protein NVS3B24_21110 [Candidatus Dormibacteria bacterium]
MSAASLADQRRFYADVLGLPVVVETSTMLAFEVGGTVVRFRQAAPRTAPTYHFALRIPGNQFPEAKSWLAARAPLLRYKGRDQVDWDFWSAQAVYATDPAGNCVELIAFDGLSVAAGGDFGGNSLLGVAELGLPVADCQAAVTELHDRFGIGLWDRDGVNPNGITPVGERGASFIVVPVGRTWFLGGSAAAHPLAVTLADVGEAALEAQDHPYVIQAAAPGGGARL